MTRIQSRIAPKDCGDPKLLFAQPADVKSIVIGTIIGTATGIKLGKMPDGVTEYKGLKGQFEAIPADPAKETTQSGVLFLGDAFQEAIVGLLESEDGPDSVSFAFELHSVRRSDAGYSWAMRPLMDAKESDALAHLRQFVPERKALAAPDAPQADEKPAKK